nr:hypothetical protein [Tanacetum cinerariifolium]
MRMIQDNLFDGQIRSDPHRHVVDFLEISNFFQYGENQEESVMLRTFPFSLDPFEEMLRICYGHDLIKGMIIQIFYHALDVPTQGSLDAEGIFLYNTPNEAFKILEDKVLLKLDFSKDSQNLKPKNRCFLRWKQHHSLHELLTKKFKALVTKIDSEFLKIRKELKGMRDGRRDNEGINTSD